MAIAEAAKELIWLKNFLSKLGMQQEDYVLYCDNQSAVRLAKNPVFHSRTKHIQMRYHFIRELINNGTLNLKKILALSELPHQKTNFLLVNLSEVYSADFTDIIYHLYEVLNWFC
nr:retrovirus-related Pol polyprotein from transposon TNT 1-94 [Tanacetum cinerariifolium]